jgi:hypothetical protein
MKKLSNQQQMRGDGTPSKKNARQMEKMAEKKTQTSVPAKCKKQLAIIPKLFALNVCGHNVHGSWAG